MTGGPISDRRIIRDENDHVTFWARSKDKAEGNLPREFELSGKEFVRRWSMHILPKGYTRSRCFGGYHGSKRRDYLNRCRELLPIASPEPIKPLERTEEINTEPAVPKCPRCDIEMVCIQDQQRPSWREVFEREIYADPAIYSPMHYGHSTGFAGFPPFPHEPDG